MKSKKAFLILGKIILLISILSQFDWISFTDNLVIAQNFDPNLSNGFSSNVTGSRGFISHDVNFLENNDINSTSVNMGDLVVGWSDPYETLYVHDTTWVQWGNVSVFNHGVIQIKNAEFWVFGNIRTFGHGKFLADSSVVGFLPVYFWQFHFGLTSVYFVALFNSCQYPVLKADH